ncbi:MAG: TonB-dependent receptor, partial [Gammaproteobacteria bacterium]|nr:TonB-dependent receptor [Gammaproteobacteria bacterium]
INGYAWKSDGYYRNAATNQLVGGGDGSGITATTLWTPSDTFRAKWRIDYSDDQFDVAAQALLNDRNQIWDLGNSGGLGPNRSNLAPLSGLRPALPGETPDRLGCAGGFLDNYSCGNGLALNDYLNNPTADPNFAANNPPGLGTYDPNDRLGRNIYNKQVVSVFRGKFPDGRDLQVSVNPNYQLVDNPLDAEDFSGTNRIVFRNSLILDWDINDKLAFKSLSGYTDAKENTETDIGKYFVDNCRPAPGSGDPAFAPQTDCSRGDGVHDGPITFFQDSEASTQQLSQEFRLAWDVTDDLLFTQGLQYWRERVLQKQLNGTTITGGPICFLVNVGTNPNLVDGSIDPIASSFLGFDPAQQQCGNSSLPAAYWADNTFDVRQTDNIRRGVDHYSWYGQLKWNATDRFTATLEARFTREDNTVTGPIQHRCLEGLSDQFLANRNNPELARDANTGRELCQDFITSVDPNTGATTFTNAPGSEAAATTGPGSVIVCGQTGRCENLAQAPGGSWFDYGFAAQNGYQGTLNRTDRYWAPKLTLEYSWTDEVLTYFSVSKGIKPGGFSLITLGASGIDPNNDGDFSDVEFEPEKLTAWELGAKTRWLDNTLQLNAALFYNDFKEKQVTIQQLVGQTLGTIVDNVEGSRVYGLEADFVWLATDNLTLSGSYTFQDSEYTDYTILTRSANDIARIQLGNGQGCLRIEAFEGTNQLGCVASFNGNELERAPRNAFALNANYTDTLGDTGFDWYGEVNFRYQGSRWLEQFNIVELQAYSRTNIALGLVKDAWDVQFYVANLFDDDTVITGGANPGIPTASFGFGFVGIPPSINAGPKLPNDVYANLPDPRLVGVRVNLRFGQ